MNYKLEDASKNHETLLKEYKEKTILNENDNIEESERKKIKDYIEKTTKENLKDYKIIKIENKIIGSLLVKNYEDGVIIDEIFIEEDYRNHKVGSSILKEILKKNQKVYLWVYKANEKAIKLYKKLYFEIEEETESRYFMKYDKIRKARIFCKEVEELSKKYDLPFFLVTDGASITRNSGCEAVNNGRENHKIWERKNGFDPEEDWREKK